MSMNWIFRSAINLNNSADVNVTCNCNSIWTECYWKWISSWYTSAITVIDSCINSWINTCNITWYSYINWSTACCRNNNSSAVNIGINGTNNTCINSWINTCNITWGYCYVNRISSCYICYSYRTVYWYTVWKLSNINNYVSINYSTSNIRINAYCAINC